MSSESVDVLPDLASPEFEEVNRYWDHKNAIYAAKILPGEYYVSTAGELITTVLGSCIAVCARDVENGIGGMNHFMLPHVESYTGPTAQKMLSVAGRYGNVAMEKLINCILSSGGNRSRLEFKVFGGARVLDIDSEVGYRNILFISEYLQLENFKVEAEDLGGILPRKVNFFPQSGRVFVKKLRRLNGNCLRTREQRYFSKIETQPIEGDVTFFGD